jgi:hypothetical protein
LILRSKALRPQGQRQQHRPTLIQNVLDLGVLFQGGEILFQGTQQNQNKASLESAQTATEGTQVISTRSDS